MKKQLLYVAFVVLLASSCTSNQNEEIPENTDAKKLNSYVLKRDATGAYSIDFNVEKNTSVATHKENNSNTIILSNSANNAKTNYSNLFNLKNNKLQIGIVEAELNKKTKIIVEDDNISFSKKSMTKFLKNYSINGKENGEYELNFTVRSNTQASFSYNEVINTYEVHLNTGEASQNNFTRTLQMGEDNILRLDFVNHRDSETSKIEDTNPGDRKPRTIIIGDDEFI